MQSFRSKMFKMDRYFVMEMMKTAPLNFLILHQEIPKE
jgi:hypothetical protein